MFQNKYNKKFVHTHSQLYRIYSTVDEGSKNWEFCESQTFNNLSKKEMVSSPRSILQKKTCQIKTQQV